VLVKQLIYLPYKLIRSLTSISVETNI